MDELSPRTRALLDAARSFDEPTDADAERVRSAVLFRVAGMAAAGTVAVTAAKSSAAASAVPLVAATTSTSTVVGGSLIGGAAIKLGAAVLVAGALASGAFVALRPHAKPPVVQAPVAAAVVTAPRVAEVAPAPVDPAPAAVNVDDLPSDDAKPSTLHTPPHVRAANLEGEMKLLRQADSALRRGDSAAALVALNQHAALYPTGVLSQEREGVRAIALCSGGNTSQGRSAAQRFLSHAAKSPLASRIRSACSLTE